MAQPPHLPGVCARFHKAVELIGARWSGALIQVLMSGPCRYAELRAKVPDISDRMLSERLRELEAEGIVTRTVVPDSPVRVDYELTDKGRALEPAIAALGKWAQRFVTADEAPATAPARPRVQAGSAETRGGGRPGRTARSGARASRG
jgi:DNA-binding HxlR family transcriptional regulator